MLSVWTAPWLYPVALVVTSLVVFLLERLMPWRPQQRAWRWALPSDLLHLLVNGHLFGILLYGVAREVLWPWWQRLLQAVQLDALFDTALAGAWPVAVQVVVALLVIDLLQWGVHNLLHRVPVLWEFHKVHHSVVDGEMDWIVSFRFHWMEVILYRGLLYVPLALLGFGIEAVMVHAIFGTLVSHLNHANLDVGWGPLRYVLNSPRLHLWHHDVEGDARTTRNFGIIFSLWDWLFGTAFLPAHAPAHIGFHGVERLPTTVFGHSVWPLVGRGRASGALTSRAGLGAAALLLLTLLVPLVLWLLSAR